MKIEECEYLMIGDVLMFPHGIDTVQGIYQRDYKVMVDFAFDQGISSCSIDDVETIPLTREILLKNGWRYNDENEKFAPCTYSGGGLILQEIAEGGFMIVATSDYDDQDTNHTPFAVRTVNELQHALKMRHINKEIIV